MLEERNKIMKNKCYYKRRTMMVKIVHNSPIPCHKGKQNNYHRFIYVYNTYFIYLVITFSIK